MQDVTARETAWSARLFVESGIGLSRFPTNPNRESGKPKPNQENPDEIGTLGQSDHVGGVVHGYIAAMSATMFSIVNFTLGL